MFLEEIIEDAQLENDRFEAKAMLNHNDVVGWLKSIAGFANAGGGDFYIGVEDKTNKLIGFDRKAADNERNFFNNQVNEHLNPRPLMSISFVPYQINGKERFIIRIRIAESQVKPVILKYKNIPAIYMRRDGFTNGATYEEIIEMSIKSKKTQYDVLVSDVKYDPSRLSDLSAFYERHNNGSRLKEKQLQSLGFMNNDGYLLNGAALFLDNYHEGRTNVQCSVFSGFHKGSERIVTVNKFSGNITSVIDYIMNFVTQRMNHSIIKLNDSRIDIDSYPAAALLEGVINAVVHRDYYLDGTQIQVDIFKDRLEITSPGGFYRSEKSGKTYDLSGVVSRNRNELIARVLTACKVMEAGSAGFAKTMQAYADADSEHKPYVCSSSDHFTLVLPDLTYERGVADTSVPVLNFAPVPQGTDFDEKVLSFCYAKARKVSEISAYLGISDSSYFRKRVLANLENNNYLEKSKISKASYYKTNPDMVVLA